MIILFIIIFVIIVLLFVLEKNKINILRRLGDTFIISGSFIFVIGLIFKFIIKSNIYFRFNLRIYNMSWGNLTDYFYKFIQCTCYLL